MSKKKQKGKPTVQQSKPAAPKSALGALQGNSIIPVKTALLILIGITFVALSPSLKNGFVFWDDPEYVLNNPYIKGTPLKVFFSTYYLSNYHPLTMLTYALEYKFFAFNPVGYHFFNMLLHTCNTILVFFFAYNLLEKKNTIIPFVTAALFAIHPMHVESVTWVSELKDVLYTFFFLSSLNCYVLYVMRNRQVKFLIYALGLYVISLFAKGQAVTLPLCFFAIDFLLSRKWTIPVVAEKGIFLILSMVFGIVAIKAQGTAITTDSTTIQNLFWGCYGLSRYILKAFLPFNLSGVYPYEFAANHGPTLIIYLSPLFVLALAALVYLKFRQNRFVLFGLLFFIANMITVLKFIPVGDAVMADRYSYIPYVGIFFALAYGFNYLFTSEKFRVQKKNIMYGGGLVLVLLSGMTFARAGVWKDSYSFWGDVISKYPGYWRSYYCLGQEYYNANKFDTALTYFTKATEADKWCPPDPYMWKGIVKLEKLNNPRGAIADFKKVLSFPNKADESQLDGRQNLGLAYFRAGILDSSIMIYSEAIAMAPNDAKGYRLRGLTYQSMQKPNEAVQDFTKSIELDPAYVGAYMGRGGVYVDQLGKFDLGIADFNKVLSIDPNNIDATINIGIAQYKKPDYPTAISIFSSVLNTHPDNAKAYYLRAICYAGMKDYSKALADAEQAKKYGIAVEQATLSQWQSQLGK